ncbi:hypothetical protein WH50_15220 [Pokkaliibacter plantistimulans]|uniref:Nitrogen fixation protein FixH n=1 Tax=Pokkaliibacter plantistimulans TaxID=1635171 RepID=A0ABX5LZ75_9GAMM|nr:FixH family protein [Pokkaliibacter plantistimulans]PXF30493.1 hypothetical protein WH50_15220 [Pokkaliibacter plantistimulans]
MPSVEGAKPWYRQPWLWFVLTPVMASMVVGSSFAIISAYTFDGVVKDEYRIAAKDTLAVTAKTDKAQSLGLHATVKLDDMTGEIVADLQSTQISFDYPQTLLLDIVHPTDQHGDLVQPLRQVAGGHYIGQLGHTLLGKRYLVLHPQDDSWRVQAELHPPYTEPVTLTPQRFN